MTIRRLPECLLITANDGTRLRELLNPHSEGSPLPYSLAHARIAPGGRSLRHHLVGAVEVYYLLAGEGRMHVDDESRMVGAGDAVVVPAGAVQHLENTGAVDLEFLNVVSPPWRPEIDVRDEDAAEEPNQSGRVSPPA